MKIISCNGQAGYGRTAFYIKSSILSKIYLSVYTEDLRQPFQP
jgi:hypothetical protein